MLGVDDNYESFLVFRYDVEVVVMIMDKGRVDFGDNSVSFFFFGLEMKNCWSFFPSRIGSNYNVP